MDKPPGIPEARRNRDVGCCGDFIRGAGGGVGVKDKPKEKYMSDRTTEVEVQEKTRQIISVTGASLSLHNVTMFDSSRGKNLRLYCDEGYVIINQDNVLAMVIDGERVR